MRVVLFIAVASVLMSCASMSKEECVAGNWYAKGVSDGSRGRDVSQFQKYSEACAEHGITANFEEYNEGRSKGLLQFCETKGTDFGRQGEAKVYPALCLKDDQKKVFDRGYKTGLQAYCTYKRGLQQGESGGPSKADVCPTSSRRLYTKGYAEGLTAYCSPKRVFQEVMKGSEVSGAFCEGKLKAPFEEALRDAKDYRKIDREKAELLARRARFEEIYRTNPSDVEKLRAEYAMKDIDEQLEDLANQRERIERRYL